MLLLLLVPLLVPLLVLLIRLLTATLRGLLQLLAHTVPTEIGLNLRRRRIGLHRVGVLLRGLRHERNSEPVTRTSVSRLLKSARSAFSKLLARRPDPAETRRSPGLVYGDRFRRGSRTLGLFTKIERKSENNSKLFLIICKDHSRESTSIRESRGRFIGTVF